MLNTSRKGFTLIELLVVIAIIGLLSTMAVVSLSSARQKSRDAKRVADLKQIQTAMELYFNQKSSYDLSGCNDATAFSACADADLLTYITASSIKDPTGTAVCDAVAANTAACNYTIQSAGASAYKICGYLEGATGNLTAGLVNVTASGITDDSDDICS